MTLLAKAMLVVFMIAWCVGVAAWFYSVRYFMPMWIFGFRPRDKHAGYLKKTLIGTGVFIGAVLIGMMAGGIADSWGGGWD